MKRIIAIIMLVMSLFMKPLFAPGTADVLRDIAAKQKEIFAEKQRKLREQEAEKKTQQEEALKQQELQKRIDELKVQEEKAQEQKVREQEAAKKLKEEQEAAKRKKAAEDPRKNIADALGDLFAANKKYAAADAENDVAKKAAYIKSGDALFKRSVTGLHDELNDFTFEELKKIVTSIELKPETQFMMLQNLIEAYVDHSNAIDAAHVKVFGDFIGALFNTIRSDELQEFLMTKQGRETLHHIQILMLSIAKNQASHKEFSSKDIGEKFFLVMSNFIPKLVEILSKASVEQREQMSSVVLDWVRNLPVDQLDFYFGSLKPESIVADVGSLRDWLLILREFPNKFFLGNLGIKYIKAAYEDGHFGTLRDALMVFRKVLSGILPPAEEARLKIALLRKAAQEDVFQTMSNNDRSMVLKYLAEYITDQGSEVLMLWTVTASSLDAVIKAREEERAKAIGTKRFADLGEELKLLRAMEKQLSELYSPSWLEQLSTTGKLTWQKLVKAWKGQEKSFIPNFESWNEKEIGRVFFNITDRNYKNYKFSSVDELIKSLSTLRDAIKWYAYFPKVQTFLKKWAQNFYDTHITFHDVVDTNTLDSDKFYDFISHSRDLQNIFFSDHIKRRYFDRRDYVADIAYRLVNKAINQAAKNNQVDIVKNLSPFAIERFMKGSIANNYRLEEGFYHPANWRFTQFDYLTAPNISSTFFENLNDAAFRVIAQMFSEQQLNLHLYMKQGPSNFGAKERDWYAKLLDLTKEINPRRAIALLDVFEKLNKQLKNHHIDSGFSDYGLKAARIAIEERLKAQQESEAKAKAFAATSASASSSSAPSASASSSSANVTTSSSTSSTSSSMSYVTRGIDAATQSRS